MNEDTPVNEVIARQQTGQALYGSVLETGHLAYKLKLSQLKKADILVLGSSRVLPFRADMFSPEYTFYNAGRVMRMPIDGLEFMDGLLKTYTPKVIILGIDLWWVNPLFDDSSHEDSGSMTMSSFSYRPQLYYKMIRFIRKNPNRRGVSAALRKNWHGAVEKISGNPAYGLHASMHSEGFRSDGSYQYGKIVSGQATSAEGVAKTLEEVIARNKGERFRPATSLDSERVDQLRRLIAGIAAHDVEVVVFLPPFAHAVYDYMMREEDYRTYLTLFTREMAALCAELGLPLYDFTDNHSLGSDDSEVIDGFHGNERCYEKIIDRIPELAPYKNSRTPF